MTDPGSPAEEAGRPAGADLDWLESRARERGVERVLDVASRDAEIARVFTRFTSVVTADCDELALRSARAAVAAGDAGGAHVVVVNLDALPFRDGCFGAAVCRGAAHRFRELLPVLRQVARVLEPRGMLLVAEALGSEDAEVALLARQRDPSHVRAFRQIEWTAFLRAVGLTVIDEALVTRAWDWGEWVAQRDVTNEVRGELERVALAAPARLRDAIGLQIDGGRIVSLSEKILLLRADKD